MKDESPQITASNYFDVEAKIRTAYHWIDWTNPDTQNDFKMFNAIMKKRREVAIILMNSGDDEKNRVLSETILYLNEEIKKVIGI